MVKVDEKIKALEQLQRQLLIAIKELRQGEACSLETISSEDFEYELKFSKKMKRFLFLIKSEE